MLDKGSLAASVDDQRVLREFSITVECVFHLLLGGRVQLPSVDLLLEGLGPLTIQVYLLIGALVDDLKTVARDAWYGFAVHWLIGLHVHHHE